LRLEPQLCQAGSSSPQWRTTPTPDEWYTLQRGSECRPTSCRVFSILQRILRETLRHRGRNAARSFLGRSLWLRRRTCIPVLRFDTETSRTQFAKSVEETNSGLGCACGLPSYGCLVSF